MAHHITIHPADRLLVTRIDGRTTADEIIASFQRAVADPTFDPSFDDLVVEGPECDLSLLSPNDLPGVIAAHDAALSAHPAYRAAPCRTAILARAQLNRSFLALIAAMWERAGAVSDDMKLCRTLDEAAAWLDREPARLSALIGPHAPDAPDAR